MAKYISRNFSLTMVPAIKNFSLIRVREIEPEKVPSDVKSAIGQPDIANIVSGILGFPVPCKCTTISLERGDILYVVRYDGSHLQKGATELPKGAKLQFLEVTIENSCLKCGD